MDPFISPVVVFTLAFSIVSTLYLIIQTKKRKQSIVKHLLFILLFLNSIWYAVLLLNLLDSGVNKIERPGLYLGLDILFSSLLFLTRFLFLMTFLRMVVKVLDLRLSRISMRALIITAIVVLMIWLAGWIEFLLYKSRGIANNILLYSDILIFFIIIVSSVYLLSQTKTIQDRPTQKAIKLLCVIFIVPISLSFFKWLMSESISIENESIESLSVYLLVLLFNGMIVWWVRSYSGRMMGTKLFKVETIKRDLNGLATKYNISKREMEVIQLICEGHTNKEIAEILFISVDTVKDHNSRIFLKTGLKNRTQLAKMFLC